MSKQINMARIQISLKRKILIAIGWVNLFPVIILGWLAVVGLPIVEMQWVGAIVTGIVGLLMLLILYTPVEEHNHG